MFFGALLPQSKYFTLIENNRTKVEVFAHYSQTRGYLLPETYTFENPAASCENKQTYEWTGERNDLYQEILDRRFESLGKIRDRGPEFRKFLTAVNTYNASLREHLTLERETGLELKALFNEMQNWCERSVDETIEGRNGARKQARTWRERGVGVSEDWLANLEEFGRILGEISVEQGGENFGQILSRNQELRERYANLFTITLDYSSSVGEIEAANETFLEALEGYELAETTFAQDYDQQQKELLYYSETFDGFLDAGEVEGDAAGSPSDTEGDSSGEKEID